MVTDSDDIDKEQQEQWSPRPTHFPEIPRPVSLRIIFLLLLLTIAGTALVWWLKS